MKHICTNECQANVRNNPNYPFDELHDCHGAYCECGGFFDAASPFGDSGIEHDLYECMNVPMVKRWKSIQTDGMLCDRERFGPLTWDRSEEEIRRYEENRQNSY